MSILQNDAVQSALIALIVVGLNALAQWVRSKVSMTKIVNDYWCYVQPVAEAVRNEVLDGLRDATLSTSILGQIVQRGVVQFVEAYKLNEGKEPTDTQVAAVNFELEDVAERAMAGGQVNGQVQPDRDCG